MMSQAIEPFAMLLSCSCGWVVGRQPWFVADVVSGES